MKTIAFDLDGVIECERHLPSGSPAWLVALAALTGCPVPEARTSLKVLMETYRIIIVTKRPVWAKWITSLWLMVNRIPYSAVYIVPGNADKIPVLATENAVMYFDDKQKIVNAVSAAGINAHVFISWVLIMEKIKESEPCQNHCSLDLMVSTVPVKEPQSDYWQSDWSRLDCQYGAVRHAIWWDHAG